MHFLLGLVLCSLRLNRGGSGSTVFAPRGAPKGLGRVSQFALTGHCCFWVAIEMQLTKLDLFPSVRTRKGLMSRFPPLTLNVN